MVDVVWSTMSIRLDSLVVKAQLRHSLWMVLLNNGLGFRIEYKSLFLSFLEQCSNTYEEYLMISTRSPSKVTLR